MTGGEFFGQFIDDYFAECDEHLATTRRVLLALEEDPSVAPDPALLRELHRALHTLKGLAGMVGDASAERVAHAMEDVLRIAQRSTLLAANHIDALFVGADALDRCIAARRAGEPSPDISAVLADLSVGAPVTKRASGPANEARPSGATTPAGEETIYLFEFAPSLELSDRGISVDVIRGRLREIGTLLDAKPRMVSGGVVFDFRVAIPAGAAPDLAWSGDGVSWKVESARSAITPAATSIADVRPTASSASVVRVDLSRLDDVMRMIADLVVTRSRVDDVLRQMNRAESSAARDALEETNALLERQIRRLREGVMRIRLVPVSEVFDRLRFAARDAIRESGKRVNLVFHGQTTEIDKQVVDRMLEPLLHVVRNAVIHGIESPDERVAAGKPADGTVTLRAAASGDRILIDVEDDGRGIDVDGVIARARSRGLLSANETVTADGVLDLLCAPGLSTRDEADMTAGRGVGMDVVRNSVRALAGELTLETTPGRGTRFAIELPLTLMIIDALLVDVGGQHMAVPQPVLREVMLVESSAIVQFENNEVIPYRGAVLPIVRLARLFGIAEAARESVYLLVVGTEATPMGLLVDRLIDLREIVVHAVTDPLVAVAGVGGATELGDGRVSLILDTPALLRLAHEQRENAARTRAAHVGASRARGGRLPYHSN